MEHVDEQRIGDLKQMFTTDNRNLLEDRNVKAKEYMVPEEPPQQVFHSEERKDERK